MLVFFLHISPSTNKFQKINLHLHVTTALLLLLHMITTNVYFDCLQLATGIYSAHIGSGKWKPLFGATYIARVYF